MKDNMLRSPLCQMQGNLFQLSATYGYDSEQFIKTFMKSSISKGLDSDYDFTQWAGKEYLFERMMEENPEGFKKGFVYNAETLYWIGYIYRFWNFQTGESSKQVYKKANAKTMNIMYPGYHTLSPEMAIERLAQ